MPFVLAFEMDFQWLDELIATVKTPRFFEIEGPPSGKNRDLVVNTSLAVPSSYKAFVLKYGSAKLYRSREQYMVNVFAVPGDVTIEGEEYLQFGATDEGPGLFKADRLEGDMTRVFEWNPEDGVVEMDDSFEQWLIKNCKLARKQFRKAKWKEIVAGPTPFTEREIAIVQARKRFSWKQSGITNDGEISFEVANHSDMVLPYLTIGVRAKNGSLEGGVWLPVGNILPGQTSLVQKGCYKGIIGPEDVELFEVPEPAPEERDRYWEFKA